MTEALVYRCKSCGKSYGPLGFHGFESDSGYGDLPVACRRSKGIYIGQVLAHKLENENCHRCLAIAGFP